MGLIIWWLSQEDCRGLSEAQRAALPEPLQQALTSREGRNGRGRLWMCGDVALEGIPWPTRENSNVRHIEDTSAGGIVVNRLELVHLKGLPGLVTDLNLCSVAE